VSDESYGNQGPSTDRHNEPVIDPTKNVLDLVEAAIKRQDDLRGELEKRMDREFSLVESRRVEQKTDTKVAVDAALNAAKEAVREQTTAADRSITKSETSASEQLRQQNTTFSTALEGIVRIQDDLKERIVKIESRKEGSSDLTRTLVSVMAVIIAALILGVALYAAFHK
jgi:phage-related protein